MQHAQMPMLGAIDFLALTPAHVPQPPSILASLEPLPQPLASIPPPTTSSTPSSQPPPPLPSQDWR